MSSERQTDRRRLQVNVPLNRVEGDLELRAELEDGVVVDAWATGTTYRGFENILVGRHALDALVIAPRVCGMCTTAHLTAAVRALESVIAVQPLADATRLRNIALIAELLQNDVRHTFLLYAPDLAHPVYADKPLHAEAVRRFQPFSGESVGHVVRESKRLLELVAVIGGQWPHSSYMVPGGVVSRLNAGDLLQAQVLAAAFRRWFEQRILGCAIERWAEVRNAHDLERWLDESDAHRESDLGFFIRRARELELHKLGRGPESFLCFATFPLPAGTAVRGPGAGGDGHLIPAGVTQRTTTAALDERLITEQVASSWFIDEEGPRHPSEGVTRPYASGNESARYSWVKAPRYDGRPAETGPLAEAIVAGDPLICDLVAAGGANAFVRQLARIVRACRLIPALQTWIKEVDPSGRYYQDPGPIGDGDGVGLLEAARGALGHWVKIRGGKISHYQIITPTTWHASPRDERGVRGPFEQALLGTRVRDPERPIELGHVVRSFDPCLVCSVHLLERGAARGAVRIAVDGRSVAR